MDKLAESVAGLDVSGTVDAAAIAELLNLMQSQSISSLSVSELVQQLTSLKMEKPNETSAPVTPPRKAPEVSTESPDFSFKSPSAHFTPFKVKSKPARAPIPAVGSDEEGPFSSPKSNEKLPNINKKDQANEARASAEAFNGGAAGMEEKRPSFSQFVFPQSENVNSSNFDFEASATSIRFNTGAVDSSSSFALGGTGGGVGGVGGAKKGSRRGNSARSGRTGGSSTTSSSENATSAAAAAAAFAAPTSSVSFAAMPSLSGPFGGGTKAAATAAAATSAEISEGSWFWGQPKDPANAAKTRPFSAAAGQSTRASGSNSSSNSTALKEPPVFVASSTVPVFHVGSTDTKPAAAAATTAAFSSVSFVPSTSSAATAVPSQTLPTFNLGSTVKNSTSSSSSSGHSTLKPSHRPASAGHVHSSSSSSGANAFGAPPATPLFVNKPIQVMPETNSASAFPDLKGFVFHPGSTSTLPSSSSAPTAASAPFAVPATPAPKASAAAAPAAVVPPASSFKTPMRSKYANVPITTERKGPAAAPLAAATAAAPGGSYRMPASALLDDDDVSNDDADDELPDYQHTPAAAAQSAAKSFKGVRSTVKATAGGKRVSVEINTGAATEGSRTNPIDLDDDYAFPNNNINAGSYTLPTNQMGDDDSASGSDNERMDESGGATNGLEDSLESLLFHFPKSGGNSSTSSSNNKTAAAGNKAEELGFKFNIGSAAKPSHQSTAAAASSSSGAAHHYHHHVGASHKSSANRNHHKAGTTSTSFSSAAGAGSGPIAGTTPFIFHNFDGLAAGAAAAGVSGSQSFPTSSSTKDAPPGWWSNTGINVSNIYPSLDSDNDTEEDNKTSRINKNRGFGEGGGAGGLDDDSDMVEDDDGDGDDDPYNFDRYKNDGPRASGRSTESSAGAGAGGVKATPSTQSGNFAFPFAPSSSSFNNGGVGGVGGTSSFPAPKSPLGRPASARNMNAAGGVDINAASSTSDAALINLAELYGNQGKEAYASANYDRAYECYSQCLKVCPLTWNQRPTHLGNRAAALVMLGRFKEAVNDCEDALKQEYTLVKLIIRKGRCLLKLGMFNAAEESFARVMEFSMRDLIHANGGVVSDPNDIQALTSLLETVKSEAKQGLRDIDRLREAVRNLMVLEGQQNYGDVLKLCESILSGSPHHRVAQKAKANAYCELLKFDEAKSYIEEVTVKTHSSMQALYSHPAYSNLPCPMLSALIWVESQIDASVMVDTRSVVDVMLCMGNDLASLYLNALKNMDCVRSYCADVMKKTVLVLSQLQSKLSEDDRRESWSWVGTELRRVTEIINLKDTADHQFKNSDFKGALLSYGSALKVDPNGARKWCAILFSNRAACSISMNQFNEAVQDCHHSLSKDPGYSRAYLRRARAYKSLRKYADSVRDYRRYLCSVPAPADSKQVQQELDNYIELTRMEAKNAEEAAAREKAAAGASNKYSSSAKNPYNHPHTQPKAPPQKGTDAYSKYTRHWFDEDDWYDHKAPPKASTAAGGGGAGASGSAKGGNPYQEFYSHSYKSTNTSGGAGNHTPRGSTHHNSSGNQYHSHHSHKSSSHHHNAKSGGKSGYSFRMDSDDETDPDEGNAVYQGSKVKDHYTVLGVAQSATEREIKQAYRKLALKYHPDKNKEAGSEDMFKTVAYAYTVLNDPVTRRQYDLSRPLSSTGRR